MRQVLLDPQPGLLGAVVEAHIISASRWSLNGRVSAVLYQPPGAPPIALADMPPGECSTQADSEGAVNTTRSTQADSEAPCHSVSSQDLISAASEGSAASAQICQAAESADRAAVQSAESPCSHGELDEGRRAGSSGPAQLPSSRSDAGALQGAHAPAATGSCAADGACCSSGVQHEPDGMAADADADATTRGGARCSTSVDAEAHRHPKAEAGRQHGDRLRHRQVVAKPSNEKVAAPAQPQSRSPSDQRHASKEQHGLTTLSARAGPVTDLDRRKADVFGSSVLDAVLACGVLLGLSGVLCCGLSMLLS